MSVWSVGRDVVVGCLKSWRERESVCERERVRVSICVSVCAP